MKKTIASAAISGLTLGALYFTQPWKPKEHGRVIVGDNDNPVLVRDGAIDRWSEHALRELEEKGVPRSIAQDYDTRFAFSDGVEGIELLHQNCVSPKVANLYSSRFHVSDILTIENVEADWLTPSIANAYERRYDANEIAQFARAGINAKTANAYDSRFDFGNFIADLHRRKISPELANACIRHFAPFDIIKIREAGIDLETALKYHKSFEGRDVLKLIEAGILADEANKYGLLNERFGARIDSKDIEKFRVENIRFEDVEAQARKSFLEKAVRE